MLENNRINVQIKGVRDGLLITLDQGDWRDVQESLLKHVEEQEGFFNGAKVALDMGDREMKAAEMGVLRDRLSDHGVSLWAVLGKSAITVETAKILGLATKLSTTRPDQTAQTTDPQMTGENGVFVGRTLRSGNRISTLGHVTIVGDVNPGAEIIAGGSIVVWGRLRGLAHAGAEGDENAVVCALDLMPTQLRIAGIIAVTPKRKSAPLPEIARVQEGQVVAEPWEYK